MSYETPSMIEIKMDAEIGSYQMDDFVQGAPEPKREPLVRAAVTDQRAPA